jgi:iron complex transport system substrate-binding protein
MTYNLNVSSQKFISQMRKLKIPLVLNNDYLEQSALARAEWLIYTASFFNKEREAQKIFDGIRTKYQEIKAKANMISLRKKILVGDIQNGKWVTCGGHSDLAHLIQDAGGDLLLASKARETQRRSLEDIYLLTSPVDIWLTQNNWTKQDAPKNDSRYKRVNAKKIFNIYGRLNSLGANDYWEMGMARPDIMLEDLATAFYPEVFSTHNLVWYKQL